MTEPNDAKMFEIMRGMDEVNDKMVKDIEASAPMCHMRKMSFETADETYAHWCECEVCGHTKDI